MHFGRCASEEYAFFKNTIILFIAVPQKFEISIVFNFSWEKSPQKKLKAMLLQNFGGTTKSIMVFLKKRLIGDRIFFKTFLGDILEVRKDSPFGRSLPVKAIIGSNSPPPFWAPLLP